jgi:tetratricopeptide (TPR) repeat protein
MITIDERYQEGCLILELGKVDKANEIFKCILNENSDYYPAINKIGVINAMQGNMESAKEYFEQALDINKNYAPALVNLGNILKESGDYGGAERFYFAAVDEDPDYAIAYHNIAVIYKERNLYNMYMKYIKEYKRAYRRHSYSKEITNKRVKFKKPGLLINITLIISLGILMLYLILFNS